MPTGSPEPAAAETRQGERGALLAGMAAMVAILGILSMIAFQEYAEVLRRDREAEMIFRAQEIVRAIQRFRLDRGGTAPLNYEDLIEPGSKGQYFIRRLYEDPLAKDGKWGFLFVGPGNQIVDPNADEAAPGTLAALSGNQGLGAFNKGQTAGQGGGRGLKDLQNQGNQGAGGSPSKPGGQGQPGQNQPGRPGQPGNPNRPGGLGGVGNPFGGGAESTGLPIAGVRTLSEDKPFRVYNGLTEYSEWLFTYFDLENVQVPGQQGSRGRRAGGQSGNQGFNQQQRQQQQQQQRQQRQQKKTP